MPALYLNQSRANSNYQSISDASGVNVSTNIFGGSHFPGSISYSKAYNSEGNYAVPGLANYVTHGDSETFGINWSENLPRRAQLLGRLSRWAAASIRCMGRTMKGVTHFIPSTSIRVIEWRASAWAPTTPQGGGHSLIPEVVTGEPATETHSGNSGYGFNVTHQLPLQGSFSASISRSEYSSDYRGSSTSGTIDMINAPRRCTPPASWPSRRVRITPTI